MPGYEAMRAEAAVKALGSSEASGLKSHETQARLTKFGRNELDVRKRRKALEILISQFSSPLVLILVLASAISGAMGEMTETAVIVGILVVNALLGFVQEYRSEQALEKLARFVLFRASVLRNGEREAVDARDLVPGDIVFIETGDIVPADIRLLTVHELAINQSILTGESEPVEKSADALRKPASSPQEMACIAFMGTSVVFGAGTGVVVATGKETEVGKTAAYLRQKAPETDFERNIKLFGEMLLGVILVMTVFIFGANALLGKDLLVSLLFALAIAVGITPEMLPMIITISLSNGAMQLARRKVVVKRLDAIEDLGNIDVLCTDKTGTLTENAITLQGHEDADGRADKNVLFHAMLASPVAVGRRHKYVGMPIDAAIWEHAKATGLAKRVASYRIADEIPFDYERRMLSVITEKAGKRLFVTKGSPESVIPLCGKVLSGGREADAKRLAPKLMRRYVELSSKGLRVIAVASKPVAGKKSYTRADEQGLTFIGFVVLADPPRKTALESLHALKSLGVSVKILSGDEPHVTGSICAAVGLELRGGKVVTGPEIAKMGRPELKDAVEKFNVFARLTPGQKLDIVSALRENGHVVGFIGDGVNDAPALHVADSGISVDTGADIAKESADIILLRHGLHVIVDGITEGRKTFSNTMKYILNTISANFGNMFSLAISAVFLPFIPLLPAQILLNNFVSDIPLMTISTDRVDKADLRMPRRWNMAGIAKFMVFFGLMSSIFDIITMAFLVYIVKAPQELFRTGWFLESTLSEILITFAIRTRQPFFMSRPSNMLLAASAVTIIGAFALVYSPFASIFEFVQPDAGFMGIILAILVAYFIVAEACKHIFFRFVKM